MSAPRRGTGHPRGCSSVIVVGASAGGVEALRAVVAGLPPDLPAPVVVVLHIPPGSPSALPGILDRAGPLPAVAAEHLGALQDGVVHVAPADHHVLVADGSLRLSGGPAENGHRPAIDPLFRSAALAYGPRAIGVVLSGTRDDGTAGLAAIAARGGRALVQDPQDAGYASMPEHALDQVLDAGVHPAAELGPVLADLARRPGTLPVPVPAGDELLRAESEQTTTGSPATGRLPTARPSTFSCPSCSGVLFELPGTPAPRFRCRGGHTWSPTTLADEASRGVGDTLWAAVRALEEQAELLERLAAQAVGRGQHGSAAAGEERAAQARARSRQVRSVLADGPALPGPRSR